jgi:snRNA-activating protein complex subunit 3
MKSELEITMENMGCLAQADALLNQLEEITDPVKNLDIGREEFTDMVFSGCDSKPQALTQNASNLLAPMLYESDKNEKVGFCLEVKVEEGSEMNEKNKLKFDKSWNFINPETNKKIEMQNTRTDEVDRITDETELIIEVVVFEGTCPTERTLFGIHYDTQKGFYRNQKRSLLQSHSFSILGSQKLTQLSDIIREKCRFSNEFLPSTNLEQPNEQQIGELNQGNFFMIEENFYADYRSNRADVSIEMRRWLNTAEASQTKIGQRMKERAETDPRFIAFAPHDQDTTRLDNLNIRLGFPYLFMHQGAIEKIIMFNDIRVITKFDCQSISSYPFSLRTPNESINKCCLCNKKIGTIETVGDELADDEPAYWCQDCFEMLHYDVDKKPVAEFHWRLAVSANKSKQNKNDVESESMEM